MKTPAERGAASGVGSQEGRNSVRRPRNLSAAVAGLRERAVPSTPLARVQERWERVVGASVAEQTFPVAERNGIVTISCRSAVWSSELAMLSETLLEQLNQALPAGAQIRALRFNTEPS